MSYSATLYRHDFEVINRLADLGLDQELLSEVVQRGFLAWASCTANHPKVIPGIWGWGESVCALREKLVPRGWKPSDENNLPYVVNQAGDIAISVATGDENTGRTEEGINPSTQSAKGRMTASAVAINKLQWYLPGLEPAIATAISADGRTTWILLMHRDKGAQEVRCELSRPIAIDEDGFVHGWAERIILNSLAFGGDALTEVGGGTGPQSPEIIVEINRRV